MPKRWLIVDGIDGAGKSTFCQALQARCQQEGHTCLLVREPDSSVLGSLIRQAPANLPPRSWALLFSAARAQLWQEQIEPALAAGKLVISDRGWPATLAYQHAAGSWSELVQLQDFATGGNWCQALVMILDLPVTLAQKRRAERSATTDHWEQQSNAALGELRQRFQRIAAHYGYLLDASKPLEELVARGWKLWQMELK